MGLAILDRFGVLAAQLKFQFPFRRDGPCNSPPNVTTAKPCSSFNSLFVGMGLAIAVEHGDLCRDDRCFNSLFVGMGLAISSPRDLMMACQNGFNSLFVGMGLAINVFLGSAGNAQVSFNSLFVGMGLAIVAAFEEQRANNQFQFPFRRDGPCNAGSVVVGSETLDFRFNSLFVGMGLAINRIIRIVKMQGIEFQFPFRRDGPCNPPSFLYTISTYY